MTDHSALLADLVSGEDSRAESAATALAQLGAEAAHSLRQLLSAGQEDHRWWAIRALSAHSHANGADFLPALQDNSPDVRQCAILALCHHPHPPAADRLIHFLRAPDPLTANLAATALAAIGADAVPALIQTLQSEHPRARLEATRALAQIRDPRAIPALMQALQNDSALMEYWATQGLENLGLNMLLLKP
jgi:HEAT repeat protein